ncbi:hypothetical protein FNB79_02975 [Formosa sediminum]|uniref:DUF5723 domain-containing protein n=1 Tax=Formosa sediminum TaxID=2594004 RepID=A0A516GN70_9FLAO|nr:hypothetical protein [Formosa sediminum]QDO92978.1 hypothetical protein FNB79_02975 [Formosa sediminum]
MSISIGTGIPLDKNKIHINIDYVSGISTYKRIALPSLDLGADQLTVMHFNESRKSVFNFGAGSELFINETLKSFAAFSTDFNGFKTNANILDLSNPDYEGSSIGDDFLHFSFGVDWKLKWANTILGVTYAGGSGPASNPLEFNTNTIGTTTHLDSKAKFTRWQFVIGIEVPFSNEKIKTVIK